jgi:hypothetical protein
VQPPRMVARRDEQQRRSVRADAVCGEQAGGAGGHKRGDEIVEALELAVEEGGAPSQFAQRDPGGVADDVWLRRLIYPAFVAAAAPGRCSADTTCRVMTCLMPSMRRPARSVELNAASTSGLASWRLMIWGCVTL